jgi:phosphate-selective porin
VGAWQLAGRYELFAADDDARAIGAATGSDLAHGPTVSVVWWFVPGARWMLSYGYTRFADPVGSPRAASDAHAIISRVDMHF